MKFVGTRHCLDEPMSSSLAGLGVAAAAVAAEALRVHRTNFTGLELAGAVPVANAHPAAHRRVVGHAERNVGARSFGRIDPARLARARTSVVATSAIDTEGAPAFRAIGTHVAVALFADRSTTINARFVPVHHAVGARNARLHEAGFAAVAIVVADAFDAHRHVVANAVVVVAARSRRGIRDFGRAVVATFDRAHVAVERRQIRVVIHDDEVAVAVT